MKKWNQVFTTKVALFSPSTDPFYFPFISPQRHLMQSLSIRELKNNPTMITRYLEGGIPVFLTQHNKPIGITLPLNESIVNQSIKELLYFDLYKSGEISFGKLAEFLEVSKDKLRNIFVSLNMPVIDYSPDEVKDELELLDNL
jgi:predicted HTH domain antitoxin